MNTRVIVGLSLASVATVAGCGGGGATNNAARTTIAHHSGRSNDQVVVATTQAPTPAATSTATSTCRTKDLTLTLGQSEGTAGSIYEPLRFTNKGATSCTLYGYPGVSFVAGGSGDQIGSPASRNPQHSAKTVILSPGASAEAVVQVVDHGNYGPDQCKATSVAGFRVYPPGNKYAAYVPFQGAVTACSTDVTQLTVEALAKPTA
jgi:hypothetical protein